MLVITLPSQIDVTSRQLIFWEISTHNSVISATTFIKNGPNFAPSRFFQAPRLLKSRNQEVQLPPNSVISATASITRSFRWCTQKYPKENRKQTMNILWQFYVKNMVLFSYTTFFFRNLIFFFFHLFIAVTGLKILTTMLIPDTTPIKNGSSFPPPRLLRAPR